MQDVPQEHGVTCTHMQYKLAGKPDWLFMQEMLESFLILSP